MSGGAGLGRPKVSVARINMTLAVLMACERATCGRLTEPGDEPLIDEEILSRAVDHIDAVLMEELKAFTQEILSMKWTPEQRQRVLTRLHNWRDLRPKV